MKMRKFGSFLAAFVLAFAVVVVSAPRIFAGETNKAESRDAQRVRVPLNLAILVQDDLVSRVGTELGVTREFIRSLPAGSRVMVGYLRTGKLQVRQPFTTDFERAAASLRMPVGSTSASPYNPYVEVREALKEFQPGDPNRNVVLLISDGLDVSRGFDWSSSVQSIDLNRAIKAAKERNVAVYSFYAPSAGLTSWNRTAIDFGQSALNRLSNETGGRAFFQGSSYVTFDAYFQNLSRALNEQYAAE